MSKIDLIVEYRKETGENLDIYDIENLDIVEPGDELKKTEKFINFLIEKIEEQDNVLDLLTKDYRDFEECSCGCNEMEENHE